MPTDTGDARVLLQVSPDDYVAERTRLVKQAKADGDRALAGLYQSLKHPGRSLWAVLAAGDDAVAVRAIVSATAELAKIQAAGSDPRSMATATQQRRAALESMVDRAVAALGRFDAGAAARRPEIRGLVDQLSRHADVAGAWIDGTLRDLPDDSWGFGAFTDLQVAALPRSEKPSRSEAVAQRTTERTARTARAEQLRVARHDVAEAGREVKAARQRVEAARKTLRDAEAEVRLAEADMAAAEQRHDEATARLESSEAD
ncbi:MAG: hypothetical protein ACXVH5_02240 [Ilumatobacteraceae bacterium]